MSRQKSFPARAARPCLPILVRGKLHMSESITGPRARCLKEAPEMRRKTFDALVSAGGLVIVAVLLVAGVLLLWGHSYASNQVSSQLSAQKIVFPATGNAEFKALPPSDQTAMGAYAGQPMNTGAQAKDYAAHFMAVHLGLIG